MKTDISKGTGIFIYINKVYVLRCYYHILTCQYGWHHSREHRKHHHEEYASGVAHHLGRVVPDIIIDQSEQDADDEVRNQSHPGQRLVAQYRQHGPLQQDPELQEGRGGKRRLLVGYREILG